MEDQGAVLDAAVAVQLVAKTTSLSISGFESEPDELPSTGNHDCFPGSVPAETAHPQALSSTSHVQPYVATTAEWRDRDALGASSAISPAESASASCSWAVETALRARDQTEDLISAELTGTIPLRNRSRQLVDLPNELLLHILGYLEVCDLLALSRVRLSPAPFSRLLFCDRIAPINPPSTEPQITP